MNSLTQKFLLEITMLAATLLVIVIVLLPIWNTIDSYPFYYFNIIFIFVFITFTRYTFLFKHTFFSRNLPFKLIILLTAIPFTFYLVDGLSSFQGFSDDIGLHSLVDNLALDTQTSMMKYIKTEMLFFGVGAILVAILFPIRMLVSIWRVINKNTV